MNFFKLYIGDYQRDTGTLSLAEHGAYLLMMQQFYATERPLPVGRDLYRLLRADSKEERDAIDRVAGRFWIETALGLVNDRCNEEITKAQTQADTNRRIAVEREARRRGTNRPTKNERSEHEACSERATNDQPNHSHSQSNTPVPVDESPQGAVVIQWGEAL
jgi:uncharacterized protein YdaU (DUF1376 family)